MAAPTVGPNFSATLDSFAGADASPIGAPYVTNVTSASHSNLQRLSNQLAPTTSAGGAAQAYRNDAQYGPTCEVWCVPSVLGGTGEYFDLMMRLFNPGTSVYGYVFEWAQAATDTWTIYKFVASNPSTVGSSTAFEGTVGNGYACVTTGTGPITFEMFEWVSSSNGPWVSKGTVTDSTGAYTNLTGAGYVGYELLRGGTTRLSTVGGGNFGSSPVTPGGVLLPPPVRGLR